MSWARVDDGMLDHAKWQRIESLGPREWSECLAVWLAVCLYANSALTDGAITWARLDRLTPLGKRARAAADRLVEAGLMDRRDDGVSLHDFLDYNLSASERAEKTAAKTRRQGKWRASRDAHVDASTPVSTGQSTAASVDSAPTRARSPSPSPSPSQIPDHDLERSLKTGHTRSPGESESDHAARVALQAYIAAEEAAGSLVQWTTGSAYAQLVLVHRLAVAQAERTGQHALEVLAAWARRYVAERHKRHPKWWADCVNDWLAAPAKATVPERRGSLPVATREQLLADALDEEIR